MNPDPLEAAMSAFDDAIRQAEAMLRTIQHLKEAVADYRQANDG